MNKWTPNKSKKKTLKVKCWFASGVSSQMLMMFGGVEKFGNPLIRTPKRSNIIVLEYQSSNLGRINDQKSVLQAEKFH